MIKKISRLEEACEKHRRADAEVQKVEKDQKDAQPQIEKLRRHQLTDPFQQDIKLMGHATSELKKAETERQASAQALTNAKTTRDLAALALRSALVSAHQTSLEEEKQANTNLLENQNRLEEATAWLKNNQQASALAAQIDELREMLTELRSARGSLTDVWHDWRDSVAEILPRDAESLPDNLESLLESETATLVDKVLARSAEQKDVLRTRRSENARQLKLREDHLAKALLVVFQPCSCFFESILILKQIGVCLLFFLEAGLVRADKGRPQRKSSEVTGRLCVCQSLRRCLSFCLGFLEFGCCVNPSV